MTNLFRPRSNFRNSTFQLLWLFLSNFRDFRFLVASKWLIVSTWYYRFGTKPEWIADGSVGKRYKELTGYSSIWQRSLPDLCQWSFSESWMPIQRRWELSRRMSSAELQSIPNIDISKCSFLPESESRKPETNLKIYNQNFSSKLSKRKASQNVLGIC